VTAAYHVSGYTDTVVIHVPAEPCSQLFLTRAAVARVSGDGIGNSSRSWGNINAVCITCQDIAGDCCTFQRCNNTFVDVTYLVVPYGHPAATGIPCHAILSRGIPFNSLRWVFIKPCDDVILNDYVLVLLVPRV